ncbi:hypothetical protein D3C86_974710 [compost metagenome]
MHHAGFGGFERQAERQRGGCRHVHPQDLQRRQRRQRAAQDRRDDEQRLRQVGGQDEEYGLFQVVVDAPALAHGIGDRGEVVVGQHHVGGFLGDLRALDAHGHADVGLLERGGVVDAVPRHADDFAQTLQRAHQAQLVFWAGAGKDVVVAREPGQFLVADVLELCAGDRIARVGHAQHGPDRHRGFRMVSGDHLYADARLIAVGDGDDGLGARRVHDAGHAQQYQALLEVRMIQRGRARRAWFVGGGQGAQPLVRKGFKALFPVVQAQRPRPVFALFPRAQAEQHIGRARHVDQVLAVVVATARHVLVAGVERHLAVFVHAVQALPGLGGQHHHGAFGGRAHDAPLAVGVLVELAVVADGRRAHEAHQRVFAPPVHGQAIGFPGDLAHGRGVVSGHAVGPFRKQHVPGRHLVHGQGAGLVRADHRHRAQRLHGGELADDGAVARHPLYAQRQNDGDDGGQALGHGRHRDADQRQEQIGQGHVEQIAADQEQGRHHDQHHLENALAQLFHLPQQRRLQRPHIAHHAVDVADLGVAACRDNDAARVARADMGAGKPQVQAVAQRGVARQRRIVLFDDGGLAGQHRFLDAEVMRIEQPDVGGDLVPRAQDHDVAGDQIAGVDVFLLAVAHHAGVVRQHAADAVQGAFGLAFLHIADDGVDDRDRQDHGGVQPMPHQGRDRRRAQQDVDQHIVEMAQKPQPRAAAHRRGQGVQTEGLLPAPDLVLRQAGRAGDLAAERLVDGKLVPGLRSVRGLRVRLRHLRPPGGTGAVTGPQAAGRTGQSGFHDTRPWARRRRYMGGRAPLV